MARQRLGVRNNGPVPINVFPELIQLPVSCVGLPAGCPRHEWIRPNDGLHGPWESLSSSLGMARPHIPSCRNRRHSCNHTRSQFVPNLRKPFEDHILEYIIIGPWNISSTFSSSHPSILFFLLSCILSTFTTAPTPPPLTSLEPLGQHTILKTAATPSRCLPQAHPDHPNPSLQR